MTKNTTSRKGGDTGNGDELQLLLANKANREQAKEKTQKEIKQLAAQAEEIKKSEAQVQAEIAEAQKKIAQNEQILARSPQLQDATRHLRKITATMEELKKELEFVQRRAQDAENRWAASQSDRMMKENVMRNKKMMLDQMNPDQNRGAFQAAQAELRMLESDMNRGSSTFQRAEEDAKRFSARLFDLDTQMKQLKQQERVAEQDETTARRLESYVMENQKLQNLVLTKQLEVPKLQEDLKKNQRSAKKLEERLHKETLEIESLEREINQLPRK